MRQLRITNFVIAVVIGSAIQAHGAVTISSGRTQNVSCTSGVCAPTASDAVLNVNDLESLLASGNIEVTTTNSGVQATDIFVTAPIIASASNNLVFDAFRSITIEKPLSFAGVPTVKLVTNDGGSGGALFFLRKGNINFSNLTSSLIINRVGYKLVNTVQSLASAISVNPTGNFAFGNSYDASSDGTYTTSPITIEFGGLFNGLGNAISHIRVTNQTDNAVGGLFSQIEPQAVLSSIVMKNAEVKSKFDAGGLLAWNYGVIFNCGASGRVKGGNRTEAGGLVGYNQGTISNSWSTAAVSGGDVPREEWVGGLVGLNDTVVENSFASGSITVGSNEAYPGGILGRAHAGGLLGGNYDGPQTVTNSYSMGSITAGQAKRKGSTTAGGLIGETYGVASVSTSYAAGTLNTGPGDYVGGFSGQSNDVNIDDYWDVTTSGTTIGVGKGDSSGITGLTTQQLQSGLPAGFDPSIWAEDPKINNGFPYLLHNPPP